MPRRLAAFVLVAGYVGGVVALAAALLGERPATLVGPVVIAITLRRVSRWVRRRTGADRAPTDPLLAIASTLGRIQDPAAVVDSMAEVVRTSTGARSVEVHPGPPSVATRADAVTIAIGELGTVVLEPGDRAMPPGAVLQAMAAQLAPALENIASRRELADQVRLLEEQATLLAENRRRVLELGDRERQTLERDLHDGAQQCLMALVLRLGLKQAAADPEVSALVHRARRTLEAAAGGWAAGALGSTSLADALRQHVGEGGPAEIRVTSSVGSELPLPVARAAFFVCVEAVQNALRHGNPTHVGIDIEIDNDRGSLLVTVTDDGCGFDPQASAPGGTGLAGAQDRVAAFGGQVAVASRPGQGTVVRIDLPIRAGAAA